MRIAHIIESTSGGSVRAALALVQELALNKEDEIVFIYSPLRADPLFEEALKKLQGVRKIAFPMLRSVGIRDVSDSFRLYLLLKRTGPYDILHAHSSKAGALARIAGAFMPRLRVVYTPHAFVTMGSEGSSFHVFAEKVLSFFSAAIIAVSEAEKEHAVRDLGLAEKKIHVIPNGLSFPPHATRGEARSRMGYGEREKVVGFIGRLSPQKNPARLIDAFALAARDAPQLQLAVVGDGPLSGEMMKRIKKRHMENRVRVWENEEARFFVPGFDALLCASDYEGFPLVFIEALQAGLPIVTTPVGGARECVFPGKTGFVARDFEPESLAEEITRFVGLDAAAQKEMSRAARQQGGLFTAQRMARSVLQLYACLAEKA